MTERQTTLLSGLLIVEHVPNPQPPPPAPEPKAWCRVCGAPHPAPNPVAHFGFWRTQSGWSVHKPCCRHGDWLECPTCETATEPPMGPGRTMTPERTAYFAVRNCPVCGDGCELT